LRFHSLIFAESRGSFRPRAAADADFLEGQQKNSILERARLSSRAVKASKYLRLQPLGECFWNFFGLLPQLSTACADGAIFAF